MDYDGIMLDPIYATIGVDAPMVLRTGKKWTPRVIDKSAGVAVSPGGSDISLQVMRPAACIRKHEMDSNGVSVDDLDGSSIYMNGKSWMIRDYAEKPNPDGRGEVYMFLTKE